MFLPEVYFSSPFLFSKIPLEDTSSLQFLTHEVPSFDVESFEDLSTIEYVFSKETIGVV